VTEGELNHLSNLSHLLLASTDIVVANHFGSFFIFALNGFSFIEDHALVADNAPLCGVDIDNLELDLLGTELSGKAIALLNGAESLLEVRYEDILGDVATNSFNGISER
jgi:hypothetical protein